MIARALLLPGALGLLLLSTAGGTAQAATVSSAGGVITVQAASGEANSPGVDVPLGGDIVVSDGDTPLTAGAGCTTSTYVSGTVYCPSAGVTRIRVLLGDLDDSLVVGSGIPGTVVTEVDLGDGSPAGQQSVDSSSYGPIEVTGGPGKDVVTSLRADDVISSGGGDDVVNGGDGADVIDLGPGDDEARGGFGADQIAGGDGADLIFGDDGMDVLRGGPGNDRLWGESDADVLYGDAGDDDLVHDSAFDKPFASGDVLHGGDGFDTANYGARGGLEAVTITLDGVANDGTAGEADNVGPAGDVEAVKGTGNADTLVGSDRGDHLFGGFGDDRIDGRGGDDSLDGHGGSDRLAGGEGNDLISGSADDDAILGEGGDDELRGGTGDDTIDGGPGADLLDGATENDVLLALDGAADRIRCSLGTDRVQADAIDAFEDRSQCEGVTGAAGSAAGALPVRVAAGQRLGAVRRRGLKVTAVAPAAGRLTARLLLSRRAARRARIAAARRVVVGSGRATAERAGSVGLTVRLTRRARSRLRAARSVTATLTVTFADASGRRSSASRKVRLRR